MGPTCLVYTRDDVFPMHHGAAVRILKTAMCQSAGQNVYLSGPKSAFVYKVEETQVKKTKLPAPLRIMCRSLTFASRAEKKALALGLPPHEAFVYQSIFDWGQVLKVFYLCIKLGVRHVRAEFPGYAAPLLTTKRLFRFFGISFKVSLSQHNVEFLRIAEQNPLSDRTFDWLKQKEIDLCNQSDHVIVVSKRDQDWLIAAGCQKEKIVLIPHGVEPALESVNPENFEHVRNKIRARFGWNPSDLVLMYHGTFEYPPNLEAMRVLTQEVYPELLRRGVQVKILGVGNLPPWQWESAHIKFTGAVPSLHSYFAAADLAVIPLRQGGGTRMKILDCFAAGIPVLSSTKGAEGLEVTSGKEIMIADDPAQMADQIISLAIDPMKAAQISESAYTWVKPLAWEQISKKLLALG